MVRVSEKFLQQITLLAKEEAPDVTSLADDNNFFGDGYFSGNLNVSQSLTTDSLSVISNGSIGNVFSAENDGYVILNDLHWPANDGNENNLLATNGAGQLIWFDNYSVTVISPSQITANQNNYNPTNWSDADIARLESDASRNITGFVPSSNLKKKIYNIGSYNIVLTHQDTNSTDINRIIIPGGGSLILQPDDVLDIFYDEISQRWRAG